MSKRNLPKTGQTYNDYTVIDDSIEITKDNKVCFHVKCKCGYIQYVNNWLLTSNTKKRCAKCMALIKKNQGKKTDKEGYISNHKGFKGFNKTTYTHFKHSAKRRNYYWSEDLTIEFLWSLLEKQNFKCAYTNLDINLTTKLKKCNINFDFMTASLDRIDNSKGYEKENVHWIHKDVNRMKHAFSEERFIELCKLIAENSKNK